MAAPMWNTPLENFVINHENSGVLQISAGIDSGSLKLLGLIELLGVYLTDQDKEKRARGTQLLSEVLHRLPQERLSSKEVEILASFFCDRLKDHHSVIPPVLYGLSALSTFKHIPDGLAQKVVEHLFKEVEVQSMAQSDRRNIYQTLSNFLATKLDELKTMGSGFVYGYIQAMDGEKDPRNLIILFESVEQIIKHFPIQNFAEELFEVTSCYFPIDFSPPPNDPFGVKKESLVLGLRKCMASTPLFAEYCLPLILEKLTSDVMNSKLEALYTLTAACETYGAHRLIEYQGSCVSAIRTEVFTASSETLEVAALDALSSYTKAFVNDAVASGSCESLDEFISKVYRECRHHLCEPDLKLVFPSGKMMQAVARSSHVAADKVLELVIPLLLEQFHKHSIVNHRRNILDILLGFIQICKGMSKGGNEETTDSNPILPYKNDIKTILESLLTDVNYQLRIVGISGLIGLLAVRHAMSSEEASLLADALLNLALNDADATVKKESVTGLAFMSMEYQLIVKEKVLPELERQLEIDTMDIDSIMKSSGNDSKVTVLNLMAAISVHSDITEHTVPRFVTFLNKINQEPATCPSLDQTITILECLLGIVKENIQHDADRQMFIGQTLPDLLKLCVQCSMERADGAVLNRKPLELTCDVVRKIVCSLDSSQADDLAKTVLKVFLDGNVSENGSSTNSHFKPLQVSSPSSQTQLIGLLMAMVCALPKQTEIPRQSELLCNLHDLCLSCDDEFSRLSAAKCLSGLVNKHQQDDKFNHLITSLKEELGVAIKDGNTRAFSLWVWLTKAFVLRGHPVAQEFISIVMLSLEDEVLGNAAAAGFYVVLNEFPDVMNQTLHAQVKMMYRQRFFMETLPKLVEGFNSTRLERKPNYLNALAFLLRFVPRQVLLSELPPLLPLMVQSLQCQDTNLWLSTLNTLYDLIHDAPEVLTSYVDSLIPLMLKLAKYQDSMKVRISSLQCLGMLTTLPIHKLVPHQRVVTRDLAAVLDDKKRLVRKEAVQARGEWFLLGK
ncbi:MMS19 nucleotide excision repair protein homolog [Lineus longissimus]|uniref:MMS19 nucleotide excision repair protein homolog n=1 Tax=Lineus longissimus TaxID=88925 RepID=UPI002B4F9298